MFLSIQCLKNILICHECEFKRPIHTLPHGLSDAIFMKLENDGHLVVN